MNFATCAELYILNDNIDENNFKQAFDLIDQCRKKGKIRIQFKPAQWAILNHKFNTNDFAWIVRVVKQTDNQHCLVQFRYQ